MRPSKIGPPEWPQDQNGVTDVTVHGSRHETRKAVPTETVEAAEVLADAFADYPWTRWTIDDRGHVARVRALQLLALDRLGLPFGHVWVTASPANIACVAVWMDSAVEVPDAVELGVAPLVAELEGRRHTASLLASSEVASSRPAERHFYLATVGTRPTHQRRGFARRTLLPMLRAADDEGIPAFLETSSRENVDFYSKLGFTVVEHAIIRGGGPDVWAMLRRPTR